MSTPSAGIMAVVSEQLAALRRSEQKVAVLADAAGMLKVTVADLARAAEVERVEPRGAASARYRELAVVFAQMTEQLRASAPALAGVRAWAEEG